MKRTVYILVFLLLGFAATAQQRGFPEITIPQVSSKPLYKYSYALVIGESNYYNGWAKLPGVRTDIQKVKQALEQHGFYVELKKDLTGIELYQAISEFIAKYGQREDARLLFYYAGHGYTKINSATGQQIGYLVPVDAPNPNSDPTGFQAKAFLIDQFKLFSANIQSKHALFVFDACFSGAIFRANNPMPQPLDYLTAKPVRYFITSGDANEQVPDYSQFRILFVRALTSNVADFNHDGYLTATELGFYLSQTLPKYQSNQHPQYGKLKDATYDQGDFVFVLNTPPPPPQTTGTIHFYTDYTGTLKIFSEQGRLLKSQSVYSGSSYNFTVQSGVVILTIYSGGSQVWTRKVYVPSGGNVTVKAERLQYATIQLYSKNVSGNVLIDGVQRDYISSGQTKTFGNLSAGSHTVEIESGGRILWNESFYVSAGSTEYLTAEAQNTNPQGRDYTETAAGVNIEMIFVKGGTFQMGDEIGDLGDYCRPVHSVSVSDFYIGKYEVTQAQWKAVMGNNPSWFEGCDDCPVESVSWYDAVEFCNRLSEKAGLEPYYNIDGREVTITKNANGYRLPTEAEWEYAARGGKKSKGYKYAGSNNIDEVAWYWKNSGDKILTGDWDWDKIEKNNCRIHPVGTKKHNELEIYDMSGNVWEWCWDWYDSDYYKNSPQNNPQGPSSGSNRVVRGGSWNYDASLCRSAYRYDNTPSVSHDDIGFRVCRNK